VCLIRQLPPLALRVRGSFGASPTSKNMASTRADLIGIGGLVAVATAFDNRTYAVFQVHFQRWF